MDRIFINIDIPFAWVDFARPYDLQITAQPYLIYLFIYLRHFISNKMRHLKKEIVIPMCRWHASFINFDYSTNVIIILTLTISESGPRRRLDDDKLRS